MKTVFIILINGKKYVAPDKRDVMSTLITFLDGNKGDTFNATIEEMTEEEYLQLKKLEGF